MWGVLAFLSVRSNIGSVISAVPHDSGAVICWFYGTYWSARSFLVKVRMVIGGIMEPRMIDHRPGNVTLVLFLSLLVWGWLIGPVGISYWSLTSVCKIWMETTKGGNSWQRSYWGEPTKKPFTGLRRQMP